MCFYEDYGSYVDAGEATDCCRHTCCAMYHPPSLTTDFIREQKKINAVSLYAGGKYELSLDMCAPGSVTTLFLLFV